MSILSITRPEKNVVEMEVSVSKETFDQALQQAFIKKRKTITVPGFRRGKATRGMIERFFGQEVFYEEAVNISYPDSYKQATDEAGIDPVDKADVEILDITGDGYSFKARVTVKPEVKLNRYKGLAAEKRKVSVSDDEVEADIAALRKRNARLITVNDRPSQVGDTVVIDFEGFVDGVAFDGGKGEKYDLELGSNSFIPGFEEQLAGVSAGDEKDVAVTFPEDYHADDLKGRQAIFKVKVHEVRMAELPELDDEFAKDVSEFDTLSDMRADIKAKKVEQAEKRADDELENALLDALIAEMEADIPKVMIDRQVDGIVQDFAYRLQMQGLALEAYLRMTGMDGADFRKSFEVQGERKAKIALALEAVVKAEGFEPTDEDIEKEYEKLAGAYGMELDKVKKALPRDDVVADVKTGKAMDLIKAQAEITMVDALTPEGDKATDKPKRPARKPAAKKAAAEAEPSDAAEAEAEAPKQKKTTKKAAAKDEQPAE